MEIQAFRTSSLRDALQLVKGQLAPPEPADARPLRPQHDLPGGRWALSAEAMLSRPFLDQGIDLCQRQVERARQMGAAAEDDRQARLRQALVERVSKQMIAAHVEDRLVRSLVEQAQRAAANEPEPTFEWMRGQLVDHVAASLHIAPPIHPHRGRCHVAAMVGPTGVGKTTTTAKLAAHFRLHQNMQVGLVAADTYRIAAVEQLRAYAEMMELPFHVAATPADVGAAAAAMQHLDLVLIDTAGCLPDDDDKAGHLRDTIQAAAAERVFLVLSSTAAAASLMTAAERFAAIGAGALVLTKFDESPASGHLLPLVQSPHLPLAYVTNGQNVPDDVMLPCARWLAESILGFNVQPC